MRREGERRKKRKARESDEKREGPQRWKEIKGFAVSVGKGMIVEEGG